MTDLTNGSPTPRRHHAVMVSSTYVDLYDLRKVLIDAVLAAGMYPDAMEHDSALPGPDVIDSSLGKVERAAGYVLLIGHQYGQQPNCPKRNSKKRSITELEYEKAVECGRVAIVFMLGEDYPLAPRYVDRGKASTKRLEAFRARAKSKDGSGGVHRVYKVVNSREELVQAATASMRDLASHLEARDTSPSPAAATAPALPVSAALPPAPPARYAVPAYIGSHDFVGRTGELALLDDWAAPEDQHPVMLFDAIGGSGKSMLTWHWFERRAPARRAWAGRYWYSFYETGASMADCCRHALAYITRRPLDELQKQSTFELVRELTARLREQPWLVVLDGLERVLVAYHRSDAATLADEALARPSDQIGERDPCAAAHPADDELLRQLSAAAPSKVLVSSRLMPQALLNRAHQSIPGVRREPLRGLRPEDAAQLLQRCGVRGDTAAMQRYVQAHCDGHPLVVGALAGLIVEPFPAAGDFDVWFAHPAGGDKLDLAKLDLVQKRSHILQAAIAAVPEKGRELLATLSLLHGGLDRIAIEALNPHRPVPPEEVEEPDEPDQEWNWLSLEDDERALHREWYVRERARRAAYLQSRDTWLASPEMKAALSQLGATLRDLQRRGLLQVGEGGEPHFDLHPVVRGVVSAGLAGDDTERLGQRVVDHFSQQAHNPYEQAQALQDLEAGFHIVRTLLRMGRFEQAEVAWSGDLSTAIYSNVPAWHETLALLKPFFPGGWLQPPQGIAKDGASMLMHTVASALNATGLREQSLHVYGATLRLCAAQRNAFGLYSALHNLTGALHDVNRLADAQICIELAMRVGLASDYDALRFVALLNAFAGATSIGAWARAEVLWAELDGMGRDWPRDLYRPGLAECLRAINLWYRGQSPAQPLAAAELLTRGANARGELRSTLGLRGQWRLAEGDAGAAVAAFDESARLARASGMTDFDTECWLVLARQPAGQLGDPRVEAERLQSFSLMDGSYALARLWQDAGDLDSARAQALRYYKWSWADGEPHVMRFDLERARILLAALDEPEPNLLPYDPSNRKRFDWQDEVEAAIVDIESQKAERDAEAAVRGERPE